MITTTDIGEKKCVSLCMSNFDKLQFLLPLVLSPEMCLLLSCSSSLCCRLGSDSEVIKHRDQGATRGQQQPSPLRNQPPPSLATFGVKKITRAESPVIERRLVSWRKRRNKNRVRSRRRRKI